MLKSTNDSVVLITLRTRYGTIQSDHLSLSPVLCLVVTFYLSHNSAIIDEYKDAVESMPGYAIMERRERDREHSFDVLLCRWLSRRKCYCQYDMHKNPFAGVEQISSSPFDDKFGGYDGAEYPVVVN